MNSFTVTQRYKFYANTNLHTIVASTALLLLLLLMMMMMMRMTMTLLLLLLLLVCRWHKTFHCCQSKLERLTKCCLVLTIALRKAIVAILLEI